MTRLQALEAVAAKVRTWCASRSDLDGECETLRDTQALFDAIAALDALPADPAPARGEVVEAVMWEAKDGYIELSTPGSPASQRSSVWTRLGTARLPLVKGDGA
jgi:hypothetical protein